MYIINPSKLVNIYRNSIIIWLPFVNHLLPCVYECLKMCLNVPNTVMFTILHFWKMIDESFSWQMCLWVLFWFSFFFFRIDSVFVLFYRFLFGRSEKDFYFPNDLQLLTELPFRMWRENKYKVGPTYIRLIWLIDILNWGGQNHFSV